MSLTFPYTYISCPCSDRSEDIDNSRQLFPPLFQKHSPSEEEESEKEEAPFDPRHPRSNFSLFPPEHLLYCEECHDIKCPRCIIEESVSYFCTSCLFETPSSAVRTEGNRCARNCFNCPICFSQLTVNSIGETSKDGPWTLNCNYCMWTSLDIDIKFDRPTNIRAQLDKIANGGKPKPSSGPRESSMGVGKRSSYLSREPLSQSSLPAESPPTAANEDTAPETPLDPASRFTALKSFYKTQLSNTSSSTDPTGLSSISGDFSYSSPASLARIMNLYSTTGSGSSTFQPLHKKKTKPPLMREALTVSEGLQIAPINPPTTTPTTPPSFSSTTTLSQRHFQTSPSNPSGNPNSRHITSLLPMPAPLATKRSKRCKACRHILVKPEVKPTSTRHRIRLVALSYIPSITFRPLLFSGEAGGGGIAGLLGREDILLTPGVPTQWLLTLRNPLFDAVRVSLGTPAVTPGKMGAGGGHRVTILCPQFEVGASGDLWDEALGERSKAGGGDGKGGEGGVAEAGKVYEWGRNWTTVVVEVVPVAVEKSTMRRRIGDDGVEEMIEKLSLDEDEDVLEISIRVRLEWRQGDLDGGTSSSKKVRLNEDEVDDGRRELAYWMVLGVGRVKT